MGGVFAELVVVTAVIIILYISVLALWMNDRPVTEQTRSLTCRSPVLSFLMPAFVYVLVLGAAQA